MARINHCMGCGGRVLKDCCMIDAYGEFSG
jgi:hypothetical protein